MSILAMGAHDVLVELRRYEIINPSWLLPVSIVNIHYATELIVQTNNNSVDTIRIKIYHPCIQEATNADISSYMIHSHFTVYLLSTRFYYIKLVENIQL